MLTTSLLKVLKHLTVDLCEIKKLYAYGAEDIIFVT